ncbi:MAG: hypothetical protein JXB48_03545 [Candidatus Latescibacteria bacterium]|nr:hypothetical protein [Candidatus Latescibacterota bacterium]
MNALSENLQKISNEFLSAVQEAFGENLNSVILYGPAARGETYKDTPYINFLVVVEDNTPSELARCSKYMKKWRKQLIVTPLFLDNDYITQSLDTFPLEFMDMQSAYHVISGEDVLKNLSFERSDVRNHCERELKGKLIHLRAEYLSVRGDTKLLIDLINRSLNTFRLLFSGALFLKVTKAPSDTISLLDAITQEYGLDSTLFKKLNNVAKGVLKIDESEADKLFDLYVEELDKLSNSINTMEESGQQDK